MSSRIRRLIETFFPLDLRRDGILNDARQNATLPHYPFHKIDAPTLVVHGSADTTVPPAQAAATARAIPTARLVTVPGGTHETTFVEPHALAAIANHLSARAGIATRSARSLCSRGSVMSAASLLSIASAASIMSVGSFASILRIGSAGSLLSICSAGSILCIGEVGGVLRVGDFGQLLRGGGSTPSTAAAHHADRPRAIPAVPVAGDICGGRR